MGEILQSRPTIIPAGKYAGVPITMLAVEDLIFLRHEFSRQDPLTGISPEIARDVQAAAMAELSRRQRVAEGRRARWMAARTIQSARQR